MSELARRLIAEAQADCTSRLEAIEAQAGLIEETESLAATLRSKGLNVSAYGYTSPAWINDPYKVSAWVSAASVDTDALLIALRDAELVIRDIAVESGMSWLHLQGLDARLLISDAARQAVLAALRDSLAGVVAGLEPAHG